MTLTLVTDSQPAEHAIVVTRTFHEGDRVAAVLSWAAGASLHWRNTPFKLIKKAKPPRVVGELPGDTLRVFGLRDGDLLILKYV